MLLTIMWKLIIVAIAVALGNVEGDHAFELRSSSEPPTGSNGIVSASTTCFEVNSLDDFNVTWYIVEADNTEKVYTNAPDSEVSKYEGVCLQYCNQATTDQVTAQISYTAVTGGKTKEVKFKMTMTHVDDPNHTMDWTFNNTYTFRDDTKTSRAAYLQAHQWLLMAVLGLLY